MALDPNTLSGKIQAVVDEYPTIQFRIDCLNGAFVVVTILSVATDGLECERIVNGDRMFIPWTGVAACFIA